MDVVGAANEMLQNKIFETAPPQRLESGLGANHIHFMLEEIAWGEMSEGKANRWLGYAQALMVYYNYSNLEKMKAINKRHVKDKELHNG